MLRKSLAVVGLLSVMLLATPVWSDSDSDSDSDSGRSYRIGPESSIPEPGAALLFGVGALLVRRQLHRR